MLYPLNEIKTSLNTCYTAHNKFIEVSSNKKSYKIVLFFNKKIYIWLRSKSSWSEKSIIQTSEEYFTFQLKNKWINMKNVFDKLRWRFKRNKINWLQKPHLQGAKWTWLKYLHIYCVTYEIVYDNKHQKQKDLKTYSVGSLNQ
jgi:hypothetical protein